MLLSLAMLTRSSFLVVKTPGGHYSVNKEGTMATKYDRSFLYILLAVYGGEKRIEHIHGVFTEHRERWEVLTQALVHMNIGNSSL